MSALPSTADMFSVGIDVCKVPQAVSRRGRSASRPRLGCQTRIGEGRDIRYRGRSSPTYCFAASAFIHNLLVRHERSHSPSLAFIEPVARDAPKRVFISTGISEVAFLLGLVIFFSDTEDGDVLCQR